MVAQTMPIFDMDFTKLMADFKVPAVDMTALVEAQRKNFEAVTAANKVAYEGVQAIAHRQQEIVRAAMEEANKAIQEFAVNGKPEDKLVKQAELAKHAFEQGVENVRELSALGQKSSGKAFDVINKRFVESLDEVQVAIQGSATNGKAK